MASGWYNGGVHEVVSGGTHLASDTLKMMLLGTGYGFNRDHAYVSDVVAHEISASGYSRVTLQNASVSADAVKDASYLDFDDPAFGPIAAGATVGYAVIFRSAGSDATSPLLMCWAVVPKATSAEIYTFPFSPSGASKFWSAT